MVSILVMMGYLVDINVDKGMLEAQKVILLCLIKAKCVFRVALTVLQNKWITGVFELPSG